MDLSPIGSAFAHDNLFSNSFDLLANLEFEAPHCIPDAMWTIA